MTEPTCGLDGPTGAYLERCHGIGGIERIFAGLICPEVAELTRRSNVDPLALALEVYDELRWAGDGTLLRYHLALHRKNAGIIEEHRQQWIAEKKAGRATAAARPARARGSTRAHHKRKGRRR